MIIYLFYDRRTEHITVFATLQHRSHKGQFRHHLSTNFVSQFCSNWVVPVLTVCKGWKQPVHVTVKNVLLTALVVYGGWIFHDQSISGNSSCMWLNPLLISFQRYQAQWQGVLLTAVGMYTSTVSPTSNLTGLAQQLC